MDKKRILIVDDETGILETFASIFERRGFIAETAKNGKEGVEEAVSFEPDVIIMDVMMPVMNGLEAACCLRKNPKTKDIPIIFCTASHVEEVKKASFANVGFLSKPFTIEEAYKKISEVL